MKKYLVLSVLAVLFAVPLSAAENVKIKLPDGLYMYDSSIERLMEGGERVGFGKYFVVKNNTFYSSQEAMRKFGVSKLNELFTENKRYKILFGGEKIGEIYNVKIDDEGDWNYKEELLPKNIKEGPMYWDQSIGIIVGRLGSAVNYVAVPEGYKEVQKRTYDIISKEEVDKVSILAKEKLYHLIRNRREITKACGIKGRELHKERIDLLDKIFNRSGELYIGIYKYGFRSPDKNRCDFQVLFSARKDNVYVITNSYDYEKTQLFGGEIKICGMLDIDGCGEEELIIEKEFGGIDGATRNLEIYKQKADGNWTQIRRFKTRRVL